MVGPCRILPPPGLTEKPGVAMRAAMPSFSFAHPFTMSGPSLGGALHAAAPPLLAFGAALALGLAGRAAGARWAVAASGAVGAFAGGQRQAEPGAAPDPHRDGASGGS